VREDQDRVGLVLENRKRIVLLVEAQPQTSGQFRDANHLLVGRDPRDTALRPLATCYRQGQEGYDYCWFRSCLHVTFVIGEDRLDYPLISILSDFSDIGKHWMPPFPLWAS
jgi:hypothetical protein